MQRGSRAAVVGTMIEPSRVTDNPAFEPYLQAWRAAREGVECHDCLAKEVQGTMKPGSDNDVHPYKLVQSNTFFHYDGGLTTPGIPLFVVFTYYFIVLSKFIIP